MTAALRAARPTARSMACGPLAGAAVAVAVLVVAQRPWDGHGLSLGFSRILVAVAALGAAFTLDDTAAATLAPSPTSLLARRAVRLALALAGAVTVIAAASLVLGAAGGASAVPFDRVALEGTGVLLLAMALSAARGGDEGAFTLAGALLAAVVIQQRWPAWSLFPTAPGAPGWSGAAAAWAALAASSAAALVVLSRDPGGGFRRPRFLGAARRRRWPEPPITPPREEDVTLLSRATRRRRGRYDLICFSR